jgi:hypothetical protein
MIRALAVSDQIEAGLRCGAARRFSAALVLARDGRPVQAVSCRSWPMGFVNQVAAWQGGGKSSYRAYSALPTTQPGGRLGAKSAAKGLQDTA